jgi:hypothetical protein
MNAMNAVGTSMARIRAAGRMTWRQQSAAHVTRSATDPTFTRSNQGIASSSRAG